jgi:HTH-type transcriptional regulator / antitoxin HipB
VIQNQHQYRVTNSKLKDLEQSLAELANNPRGLSARLLQSEKAGLQVWIDRLKAEIDEYDRLKQGESTFKFSSLPELPIALIKARIAKGMTQKQLAEKIGVREQQIQRYESSHYCSASFDRVTEISEALEISFSEIVMGVSRGSTDSQLELLELLEPVRVYVPDLSIDEIKTALEKIYQQSDDLRFEHNISKFLKTGGEASGPERTKTSIADDLANSTRSEYRELATRGLSVNPDRDLQSLAADLAERLQALWGRLD